MDTSSKEMPNSNIPAAEGHAGAEKVPRRQKVPSRRMTPSSALKLGAKVLPWACVSRSSRLENTQAFKSKAPSQNAVYSVHVPESEILVSLGYPINDAIDYGSHPGVILSPRGLLAISEDIFGCHNWEGKSSYWHLVSRGQRCCQRSYNAQDSSPQQRTAQPKMSIQFPISTQDENPCP